MTFVARFRRAFISTSYYAGAFLILFLLQHILTNGAVARRVGMSVGQLIALHVVAALVVALAIAVFHRALRTRTGAVIVGVLIAAPLGAMFSATAYPTAEMGQYVLAAIIAGVSLGGTLGAVCWDRSAQ